jgi:hypothetical protein
MLLEITPTNILSGGHICHSESAEYMPKGRSSQTYQALFHDKFQTSITDHFWSKPVAV